MNTNTPLNTICFLFFALLLCACDNSKTSDRSTADVLNIHYKIEGIAGLDNDTHLDEKECKINSCNFIFYNKEGDYLHKKRASALGNNTTHSFKLDISKLREFGSEFRVLIIGNDLYIDKTNNADKFICDNSDLSYYNQPVLGKFNTSYNLLYFTTIYPDLN